MKKLIAKAEKGREFLHSRHNAFFCSKNAQKIADILNSSNYNLREGEVWHVYDYDVGQELYVEKAIFLSRGSVKTRTLY